MKSLACCSLLFAVSIAAAQQHEVRTFIPPRIEADAEVAILFTQSYAQLVDETVNAVNRGRTDDISLPELRNADPLYARRLLPSIGESDGDHPRAMLGRYVLIRTREQTDKADLARALAQDPRVSFVAITESAEASSHTGCDAYSGSAHSWSSISKTWPADKLRLPSAHLTHDGHAYVAVSDNGAYGEHSRLKDFNGLTYLGGNFHPHLSYNTGYTFNPSSPTVYAGTVDESRHPVTGPQNCDYVYGNRDGYNTHAYVGHGTHVAGLIGAKKDGGSTFFGACPGCPLSVSKITWSSCPSGQVPGTIPEIQSWYYDSFAQIQNFGQSMAWAIAADIGAQVVNASNGRFPHGSVQGQPIDFCGNPSNANHFDCLTLQYLVDRDIMLFAAVGNNGYTNAVDFPAQDWRVYGVAGIRSNGQIWQESYGSFSAPGCGSNRGSSSYGAPSFAGPAYGIYSTMFPHKLWNGSCHEYNDGLQGDGFGYCTGTSMSTPLVAGVSGLVRSANPLASRNSVFTTMRDTADRTPTFGQFSNDYGWGLPRADLAVNVMIGKVGGVQKYNRAIPLFSLYGSVAQDYLHTTKPQVAVAFFRNTTWSYSSDSSSPVVSGYAFKDSPGTPTLPQPRADVYVLATKTTPIPGKTLIPLRRMRYTNGTNADGTLVESARIGNFKSVGYEMEGIEGYVFAPCSPEPSCIPPLAVKIYRAYNFAKDDHAVFPASRYSAMVNGGYNYQVTMLGYAYPNVDTDGDGLIDGLERVIGTNELLANSDCSGSNDGVEYPLAEKPVSDPMLPMYCP